MPNSNLVDRSSNVLWLILLALGVFLTIVGWARFWFA